MLNEDIVHILDNIPIRLTPRELLRQLALAPESLAAQEVAPLLERVRPLLAPQALYRELTVQHKEETAVVLAGIRFCSRLLRENLDQAERVFPFLATCGPDIDAAARHSDDPWRQYCLETVQTITLRQTVDVVREHLQATYSIERLSMMNPGSLDDWPLSEQAKLFALFGEAPRQIGVALTAHNLMTPLKSLSGLMFPSDAGFVNCQLCPRSSCPARVAPYAPDPR